jgi:hypothetical protein
LAALAWSTALAVSGGGISFRRRKLGLGFDTGHAARGAKGGFARGGEEAAPDGGGAAADGGGPAVQPQGGGAVEKGEVGLLSGVDGLDGVVVCVVHDEYAFVIIFLLRGARHSEGGDVLGRTY